MLTEQQFNRRGDGSTLIASFLRSSRDAMGAMGKQQQVIGLVVEGKYE